VLRRVFGPEGEEVAGGWRRLHNEELHNLCGSQNIRVIRSRKMSWTEHVARIGEMNAHKILVSKPEGKRPLGRPRCRWEDNNRMDLREIRRESMDWIHPAQDRDRWRAPLNTV
jgi:hypothetical protein